jgi:hypothetical protein
MRNFNINLLTMVSEILRAHHIGVVFV